jgi:hypothetical protein
MKRVGLVIVLLQTAFVVTAWCADLSGFVGKSVQDSVGGYQLFAVPDLKKSFIAAFGSDRYQRILLQMQGDGIKSVADQELGKILVTGQCEHHNCPNQSVLIAKLDGTVVGLCLSDVAPGNPNQTVIEWSGLGWSLKRTAPDSNCRSDTPEPEVAAFKAARGKTM